MVKASLVATMEEGDPPDKESSRLRWNFGQIEWASPGAWAATNVRLLEAGLVWARTAYDRGFFEEPTQVQAVAAGLRHDQAVVSADRDGAFLDAMDAALDIAGGAAGSGSRRLKSCGHDKRR